MAEGDDVAASGELEDRKSLEGKPGKGGARSSDFWQRELKAAGERERAWRKSADAVVRRFRDERDRDGDPHPRKVNILWANTEVLKSALYARPATPVSRRLFPKPGQDNRIARTISLINERVVTVQAEQHDFDEEVSAAVEDVLLPGRGVLWLEYHAETGEPDESGAESESEEGEPEAGDIEEQTAPLVHVDWEDYRDSDGKRWRDKWWVARRHKMTRADLRKAFAEHADSLALDATAEPDTKGVLKRAEIWEVWDKTRKERVWVKIGYPHILRTDPDPCSLRDFFPCPPPLYAVRTTSTSVPVPLFKLYQDQADELDRVTTRISRLTEALKRRGIYDATVETDEGKLKELADAGDNQFLPVKNFMQIKERGGLKGVFDTEDLEPYAKVLAHLYERKASITQEIYEIVGIADIMRGASDPRETKGAQQLKAQFGSVRLKRLQRGVQKFIRSAFRLQAELAGEHFQREVLEEMTGIRMPMAEQVQLAKQLIAMSEAPQPQTPSPAPGGPMAGMPPAPSMRPTIPPEKLDELRAVAQAVPWEEITAVLRSDERRAYKVDVETDSTVLEDQEADKASRLEFVTTMKDLLAEAVPAMQANPTLAPFVKEMVLFMARGFTIGRQLEEALEDAFDQLMKAPSQPPGDPVADAKAKAIEQKLAIDAEKGKADLQGQQQRMEIDRKKGEMEVAAKMQEGQLQKILGELQLMREQMALERERMRRMMAGGMGTMQ